MESSDITGDRCHEAKRRSDIKNWDKKGLTGY